MITFQENKERSYTSLHSMSRNYLIKCHTTRTELKQNNVTFNVSQISYKMSYNVNKIRHNNEK